MHAFALCDDCTQLAPDARRLEVTAAIRKIQGQFRRRRRSQWIDAVLNEVRRLRTTEPILDNPANKTISEARQSAAASRIHACFKHRRRLRLIEAVLAEVRRVNALAPDDCTILSLTSKGNAGDQNVSSEQHVPDASARAVKANAAGPSEELNSRKTDVSNPAVEVQEQQVDEDQEPKLIQGEAQARFDSDHGKPTASQSGSKPFRVRSSAGLGRDLGLGCD